MVCACRAFDPRYVLRVMEESIRREIKPNTQFLDNVKNFKIKLQRAVVDHVRKYGFSLRVTTEWQR